jgi:hypothetical protein
MWVMITGGSGRPPNIADILGIVKGRNHPMVSTPDVAQALKALAARG